MRKPLTEKQREHKRAKQRKGELSREEAKAKKHQQMIVSERRRKPDVMWDELLFNSGGQFEDVKFKKVL
tara:strand:+ start:637 stop:843 length:207 start_codon:yes stop_codon:yes gene_type:complete